MIGFVKTVCASALLLTLTGCSGTYHSYMDMLKLAFTGAKDVELSLQQVDEARSDLLYVKHGDRPVAAMALFELAAGQHKWVSADNAMLIMQQGRIVRTVGLSNNLLHITNTVSDPLRAAPAELTGTEWLRLADWQAGEYGYAMRSTFELMPPQTLTFFQQDMLTTLVVETVSYKSPPDYLRFDGSWQNRYWFDSKSGSLIKSEQLLAPFAEPITMTYISRIARLLRAPVSTTARVTDHEN